MHFVSRNFREYLDTVIFITDKNFREFERKELFDNGYANGSEAKVRIKA